MTGTLSTEDMAVRLAGIPSQTEETAPRVLVAPERRRGRVAAITGMGVVSSLGLGAGRFWQALKAGETNVDRISLFDAEGYPSQIAGEVRDFRAADWMDARDARRMARFSQFAVAAARMALDDASLAITDSNAARVGVYLGTGIGSLGGIADEQQLMSDRGPDRVSPFFIPAVLPNMGAAQVARIFGARGYNSTVTTACAASTQAMGEGLEVIRRGAADVMLVGGADASICALGLAGFCAIRALSTRNDEPKRASRPFDAARDGFVPGEGAAILVIESLDHALARGARIYALLAGFGSSSDAYHLVAPDPEGDGAARAMQAALADAGVCRGTWTTSTPTAHPPRSTTSRRRRRSNGCSGSRRPAPGHKLHQVHGGPPAGGIGRHGGRGHGHVAARGLPPSHHKPGGARPGVRPGLRGEPGPAGGSEGGHEQLLRLRRPERLPGVPDE